MPDRSAPGTLRQQVRILFNAGSAVGLSDRDLLERFLDRERDFAEAAFEAIVERHGAMVLRVCTQSLRDRHAAEDAFQATFLVLARHARSIRRRDSLASWLFGVASRSSARIRMTEARRRRHERRGAIDRLAGDQAGSDPPGSWPELHAEIDRLPEKYRIPIVLCYFDGLTHEQAADRLGWPVGTVKTRLARARDRLRRRLERRGGENAPLLSTGLVRPSDVVEVPRLLLDSTNRTIAQFLSGAGGAISPTVLAISKGVSIAMLIHKLRLAALALFVATTLGLGVVSLARQAPGDRPATAEPAPTPTAAREAQRTVAVRRFPGMTTVPPESIARVHSPFDCRVDKVLVDLGSRVSKGGPLLELFSTELGAAKSDYELALSQWKRDKKVYEYKKPLIDTDSISHNQAIQAESDEAHSRLKMKIARDKLLMYGLRNADIDGVPNEDGIQKARLILRSPADGIVIKRDVVPGNYYGPKDILLVIAGDDFLHITADVDPRDAAEFVVGQPVTLSIPFVNRTADARLEAINREFEPESKKVTLRTTIRNPDHRLKPGMYVGIGVEGAPSPRTEAPTKAADRLKSAPTLDERVGALERKLDRLLAESNGRAGDGKILERLDELERKLDRALKPENGQ